MQRAYLQLMPVVTSSYNPPFYFKNGHVSTVVPSIWRQVENVNYERERIETPDDDFLDLDWCHTGSKNLVVITHGLEGSSKRPYVLGMAKYFHSKNWNVLAWNCRSCSGEINRKGCFYHHGETRDLHHVVKHAIERNTYENIVFIGFSMGGSITIKFLSEVPYELQSRIKCGVTASVPVDLTESVAEFRKISMAFYRNKFLQRLEKKIKLKAQLYPDQIDYKDFSKIKYFPDFDNAYTVPLHGFKDAYDFYEKASAKNYLERVQVPLLLVNALNDPFLTENCYPYRIAESSDFVHLETPKYGGHVGFIQHGMRHTYLESRAYDFVSHLL